MHVYVYTTLLRNGLFIAVCTMKRLRPFYVYVGVAKLENCDTFLLFAGKYT